MLIMDNKNTIGGKATVHRVNEVYRNKIFAFIAEDVTLPNDSRAEMAFVRHPGSTAIVPFLDDNTVIMERQYRHPVRDYLFEIPAGTMDPGETALECAGRELEEETGYVAEEFLELGKVHILPAYSDELIYVYLARGLTLSEQNLDQNEIIHVVQYPLDQALQMITAGRITDALTILALQWAWFSLKGSN
jgi:ADP-ribose pyrophosphatase